MSDGTERPADRPTDADAWETACAEDLAQEKARRRAGQGPQTGSAAEELRRLAEAVGDRLAGIQLPATLGGMAAQQAVGRLLRQARSAVEPVVERNPDALDHLAAAGSELLAAYRAVVREGERRWTESAAAGRRAAAPPPGPTAPGPREKADPQAAGSRPDQDVPGDGKDNGGGPGGSEKIDLD